MIVVHTPLSEMARQVSNVSNVSGLSVHPLADETYLNPTVAQHNHLALPNTSTTANTYRPTSISTITLAKKATESYH